MRAFLEISPELRRVKPTIATACTLSIHKYTCTGSMPCPVCKVHAPVPYPEPSTLSLSPSIRTRRQTGILQQQNGLICELPSRAAGGAAISYIASSSFTLAKATMYLRWWRYICVGSLRTNPTAPAAAIGLLIESIRRSAERNGSLSRRTPVAIRVLDCRLHITVIASLPSACSLQHQPGASTVALVV